MERVVQTLAHAIPLPAAVWAFALDAALSLRRGEPIANRAGDFTLNGDTYTAGLSDDHSKVVILKTVNQPRLDAARLRLRGLLEEGAELTPVVNEQWPENDPDADKKADRKAKATRKLGTIEAEKVRLNTLIEETETRRIEIDLGKLGDFTQEPLTIGLDRGKADVDLVEEREDRLKIEKELEAALKESGDFEKRALNAEGFVEEIAKALGAKEGQNLLAYATELKAERDALAVGKENLEDNAKLAEEYRSVRATLGLQEGDDLIREVEGLRLDVPILRARLVDYESGARAEGQTGENPGVDPNAPTPDPTATVAAQESTEQQVDSAAKVTPPASPEPNPGPAATQEPAKAPTAPATGEGQKGPDEGKAEAEPAKPTKGKTLVDKIKDK